MLKSSGARQIVNRCRRGVFDYLAAVQGSKSPEAAAAKERTLKDGIPWDFIDWYRTDVHALAEEWDKMKNLFGKQESYANEPARPYKAVNWDEWAGKIADPSFVDTVKADFLAKVDIANSYTTPAQMFSWSDEAKAELLMAMKESCSAEGLAVGSWTPPATMEEYQAQLDANTKWAEGLDAVYEQKRRTLELDYEQVEAERDMFGVRGEMMEFAEHPQRAEMLEENAAGKQTYVDKVLEEWEYCRYAKRERLASLQNETQRQAFLEKFRSAVKIHGCEESLGQ